ncbi:hypothetical protein PQR46_44355, partial [Paraburkholderia sediminicola]|uniref:hypothetical protein n=1 Tax=Paraburkholderia sediminicola TaxID=458836 RepID=UPI0038BC1DF2
MPAQLVGSRDAWPVPDRDKPRFEHIGQRGIVHVRQRVIETARSQQPVRMLIQIFNVPKLARLGRCGQMT